MASLFNTLSRINNRRTASASIDINAETAGRRPSGDPRIDLAVADRR